MSQRTKSTRKTTTKHMKKTEAEIEIEINADANIDIERWEDIPGSDVYQVSDYGNIMNKEKKKLMKPTVKNEYHYYIIKLDDGNVKSYRVHRLVAAFFVKNKDKKKYNIVNHIDGNKLNNHYKNLEWTDAAGNNNHAVKNNLTKSLKREISQYVGEELFEKYKSLTDASNATGFHMSRIVEVCKGQREEYEGYVFKYTVENKNDIKLDDPKKAGFKSIKTYPTYWVNNKGQIYSSKFKRFLKPYPHKNGCLQIQMRKMVLDEKTKKEVKKASTVLVHNLVGSYFLPKPNGDFNYIKHRDGDKTNNNIENLEWGKVAGVTPNFNI